MTRYPLALSDLKEWEDWLDYLNHSCIVPSNNLSHILTPAEISGILQRQVKSHQNIPYVISQAHLSKRYINDAWIWAQILQTLFPVEQITELCGGTSILIDVALSYLKFDKTFEKIDYQSWDGMKHFEIQKSYRLTFKNLNVITQTGSIPKTDMIILNHSVDDLYIGLWDERHQQKFWEDFTNWDKVDSSWELAMPERDLYLPILKDFFKNAIGRLNSGGYLIIRDYPSAYETHRKHLKRINFTRELTHSIIEDFTKVGLSKQKHAIDASYHPLVQETFFVYKKVQ